MTFEFGTPITISNGSYKILRFESLQILIANLGEEWAFMSSLDGEAQIPDEGPADTLSAELDLIRWDCASEDETIVLIPTFPDLPVIARPRGQINIPPRGKALFHLGIPASIRLQAHCEGILQTLASIPTQTLSKTWHGNQHAGEACYALNTLARRKIIHLENYAHDIICQVQIHNASDEATSFERLYIETKHFSVFSSGDQLWSNACRIKVKDADETLTRLVIGNAPLEPAEKAKELVPPISGKTDRSQLHKVFSSFFDVLS